MEPLSNDSSLDSTESTFFEDRMDSVGEVTKQVELVVARAFIEREKQDIGRCLSRDLKLNHSFKPSHADRNKIKHLERMHEHAAQESVTETEHETDETELENDKAMDEKQENLDLSIEEEKDQAGLEEESKIKEDLETVETETPPIEAHEESKIKEDLEAVETEAPPIETHLDTKGQTDVVKPAAELLSEGREMPYTLQSIIATTVGIAGVIIGVTLPSSTPVGVIGLAILGVGATSLYKEGKRVQVNKPFQPLAV